MTEEKDEEGGDGPGSGWFEVKKKHRASSKLSTQKISGGSSNRAKSHSPRYQAHGNGDFGNSQSSRQPQNLTTQPKASSDSTGSASKEDNLVTGFVNKSAINQKTEFPKALHCASVKDTASESQPKASQEVPSEETSDSVLRIKWGDLDVVPLALDDSYGDSGRSPKISCSVVDENLQVSEDYAQLKATVVSEGDDQLPNGIVSSVVLEESRQGTWEADATPSADNALRKVDLNDVIHLDLIHDGAHRKEPIESLDGSDCNNLAIGTPFTSPVDGSVRVLLEGCYDKCQEASDASEVSGISLNVGMTVGPGTTLPPGQQRGADVSLDASFMCSMEECHEDHIKDIDHGEDEVGESKERFRQRLWCFLFENLNRAVDELYLLCELECDLEQMNEANLVLEEAASDFRELKCRVEDFEYAKKSAKDGIAVNVRTDHRRPHSLSWEVRRMTTSPHRAEILSSSLEAFKKIQRERASMHVTQAADELSNATPPQISMISSGKDDAPQNGREPVAVSEKKSRTLVADQQKANSEKKLAEMRHGKAVLAQNGRLHPPSVSISAAGKCKEALDPTSEVEKQVSKKDKVPAESRAEKTLKTTDMVRRHISLAEKEKEKERERRVTAPWKSMDAWKEKRNWEDILKSPLRSSSRVSHSPGLNRKGMERARVLHDKLMSPEKKKKSALDLRKEAEEKHARALRIRSQLENERVQRLQRTSEKLNRVNEWQAVRSLRLREGMHVRHQRSETRHEAYLAQVARRAGDESSKVNEVRFITSLNEENKKLMLRQRLHDSEMRRAEKLQVIRTKQKEDIAREEAALERRKVLEAEKLQRLAEIQRKKEEAQVRREEERKASSAAREAKAVEHQRRKEVRARAQQEEAELLAQRLAERLGESEQRRNFYLEQIREKASINFRDQSSPLLRRSLNKDSQGRSASNIAGEDGRASSISNVGESALELVNATQQHPLKRRIKKIRQRLMSLKYEYIEPTVSTENTIIGYRALVGAARAKIGRWLQDLQKLRQARKEGAVSIGLIVSEMVKFLEGKDPELHASRQAGLLDFISSALPASHTSKPETSQVTVYLLRLLRVVLSVPANRSYFLAHNLLPPIIPILSTYLENYIKIVASSSPGSTNLLLNKTSENLESTAEALDGFLWTVTTIMGHVHSDERQTQMQDGLMELIVAYQVIHRLRDLFALYDRPQVEGSPFPSSILLSLNLLAVLTSRPGNISSIDWDTCISQTESCNSTLEQKYVGYPGIRGSSVTSNLSGDYASAITVDVIQDLPANEPLQMVEEEKSPSTNVSLLETPEVSSITVSLDNGEGGSHICATVTSAESQSIELEEHAQLLIHHKEKNNSTGSRAERKTVGEHTVPADNGSRKETSPKQPLAFLLSATAETGLVSLPSLLTGVLLQANNRLSSGQASYILPSNFEEVATGVLKVLNNLAILDIALLQNMLARSDLKMEFFHLMSFLLSHCSSKWKAANDQVGILLLECLLLLGYFALFHPGNQAVLRWGKSPTILQKVCDLPFAFFSDPELTPILAGTLVAACYGCELNKGVLEQELNTDMLLSLLKSCRQSLPATHSDPSPPNGTVTTDPCDNTQIVPEARKPQGDFPLRTNRKSNRVSLGKGVMGSNARASKTKTQRDSKGTKTCDEWAIKHNLPAYHASSTFMLHCRFPSSFLYKAEEFFSAGTSMFPVLT